MRLTRLQGKYSFAYATLTLGLLLLAAGRSVEADPVFDARGFQPNREFLSELPFEHIDPMTGNVLLTFTDLVLPGNAGFDLRVQRTYNSKIFDIYQTGFKSLEPDSWAGVGWRLHMGRVLNFQDNDPGPIIEMPDGSQHRLYRHMSDGSATRYITKDYWTYEKAFPNPILRLPNGIKYTFGHWQGGAVIYATQIEDPFGNKIVVDYQPPPAQPDVISSITQHLVGGQTRTVDFTYNPTLPTGGGGQQAADSLATMTFKGRIWTYTQSLTNFFTYTQLDSVEPPVGPSWEFQYEHTDSDTDLMLKHLETPTGGEIDYTYVPKLFYIGSAAFLSPALTQRQLSGRDVPSGTWSYAYLSQQAENHTTVTSPCNIKTTYAFMGIGPNANQAPWAIGALDKRTTSDGNDVLFETEDLTWIASVPISNSVDPPLSQTFVALLGQRDLIRPGKTFTTQYTYSNLPWDQLRPNNFNDFGRAHTVGENGDSARTTTRTFFYGSPSDPSFGTYIVDKVASDTVQVGGESFSRSFDYDAATGFKKSETIYGITTTFTPFPSGNVQKVKDANNHSTSYTYEWGVADVIQTPEYTIERSINDDSTIASEKRRGFTTSFEYDALMRPTKTDPPLGNDIDTVYDNSGGATVTVTRDQSSLTAFVDGFARPHKTQNGVNIKTEITYDACGRKIFVSYPFSGGTAPGTTYVYDPLGRVEKRTHVVDNTFVEYDYSNGVDVLITDEEDHETFQDWSAFGDPADARLLEVTDAEGVHTKYTYNALGNLKSATLPGETAAARTWVYDDTKNQLESEVHPEGGQTSYTYDPAGNLKTRTDAQFGITTFSYDGNNRVTGIDRPGGGHDAAIGYDDSDNRTELTTSDVSSVFQYDPANRLTSRTDDLDGVSLKTVYQYDSNDNLDILTYPSGAKVKYHYDSENRILRIEKLSGPPYADDFEYHPSGALQKYVAGNGLTHTLGYDTRYRLQSVNAGETPNLTYTYWSNSNVKRIQDTRGGPFSPNFFYDDIDRLTDVTVAFGTPTFSYDHKGNRLTKEIDNTLTTYTYDANSQYLFSAKTGSETEIFFSYDLNGNMTADGTGTYTYAPTNMLSDATVAGASTRYLYDGDDLRKVKIAADGISFFTHGPGGQLLGEYQATAGTPQVVREYVMAGTRLIAEIVPTTLTIAPASLNFMVILDQNPSASKTLALSSNGGSVNWTASENEPWLTVSPANGGTPATVTVQVNASNLAPGSYPSSVTFTATGAANSPVVVPIQLTVFATASLYVNPSFVNFFQPAGGPSPDPRSVEILYPGGSGNGADWQATTSHPWISISPSSGTTPSVAAISVTGQGLPPGTHQGTVTVTAPGTPGSPQTVAVELVIGAAGGMNCAADASYCEIFDDEPLGDLDAGWVWSEPNVPQVVPDPRNVTQGNAMKLDPVGGARLNGDVDLSSPHAISGTEISVQVMTRGTNPAIPWSLAKIEFYTEPGAAWGKTTRTFGTIRFGSNLRFQYGRTDYAMLANPMKPGRWYSIKVRYVNGQAEVYVDGVLKFSTPAPDPALQMEGFSLTSWDFAPGVAYADVLEVRPSELVVDPMKLALEVEPGGSCPDPGFSVGRAAAARGKHAIASPKRRAPRLPATTSPMMALPVAFEPNMGQADSSVDFVARAMGHLMLIRQSDIIFALPEPRQTSHPTAVGTPRQGDHSLNRGRRLALVRMKLAGSKVPFQFEAQESLPGLSHYFVGDQPSRWRSHVPHYASVVARDVYPGVDFVLRDSEGRAEYDLVVAPGIDPAVIELQFEGTSRMAIERSGDLVFETALGHRIRQRRPVVYQEVAGERRPVSGGFKLLGQGKVTFEIGAYDPAMPLVIDPVVVWSNTLGGSWDDGITDLAVDASESVYVTGSTMSVDFPVSGAFQPVKDAWFDAFVTKLLPDGTGVSYSSFLGGSGDDDEGRGVALDASGRLLVVGRIGVTGFPAQSGSFPIVNASPFGAQGSYDLFVAKVESDGSQLVYSTRVGGSGVEEVRDVALGPSNTAHLGGSTDSLDFPLLNPYQSSRAGYQDAMVLGISQTGNQPPQIAYSTYIGGTDSSGSGSNRFTAAAGIAVDAAGGAYVAGETNVEQFTGPVPCLVPGAPATQAFVAKLSGGQLAARCFGGSAAEKASGVALAPNGAVWVAGETTSSDFPVQMAPFAYGGSGDAFVTGLSSDLSLITLSTPFGGDRADSATALAVDAVGHVVATGVTASRELPVVSPLQACPSTYRYVGAFDSFLLKIDPGTSQALYATYLPAIPLSYEHLARTVAAGADGSVYVGGETHREGGFGVSDGFVTKVQDGVPPADPGTITLNDAENENIIDEHLGPFVFQVERLGGGTGTVSADVITSDDAAVAGVDYEPLAVTAVFAENQCHSDYEVPIIDDTEFEQHETFFVNLSNPTGGASLGPKLVLIPKIWDNDCEGGGGGVAQGTFTISHRSQPVGPTWQATVDVPWLSLDETSGVGPSTVIVTANPAGLEDGTYIGRITVTATDATGSPQVVEVTFTVSSEE